MVLPELNSWGFRLLGGRAGKLALRPLWDKNPAVLWIIKGFSGPSGEGSGNSWVPGCQWTFYPGSAGNPGHAHVGPIQETQTRRTKREEIACSCSQLSSLFLAPPSGKSSQKSWWPRSPGNAICKVPSPAPADHG